MRAAGGTAALLALLALGPLGCGRKTPPPEAAVPAAASAPAPAWTWHPLGALAVVEGEVTEPTDLVLEGRSVRETRFAEPGPVRWEFYRPPEGETAVLRTAEGRELARFRFIQEAPPKVARQAPPKAAPAPRPESAPAPKVARQPAPPPVAAPAPAPEPPSRPEPRVRTQARHQAGPVGPLANRRTPALPAAPAAVPTAPPVSARVIEPTRPQPQPAAVPAPRPARAAAPEAPLPPLSGAPWPGMGEALNLTRGPAGRKRLLLSFDGGSNAEVATEILDTLQARGVRTTLFLTGAFIQHFPALVKRMAAEGHELGNHTMNHPHFAPGMKRDPKWTRERVQRELLEADAALVRLLGRPMDPVWRAPYGEHTAEIRRWAEELGYRHVGWSEGADTLDWATPRERGLYRSGDAILQRLQARLDRDGDGLIVLMHLGSERAAGDRPSAGLGAFMDRARKAGWSFVPVGTFLQDLGKPAWDPQRRLALLRAPEPATQAR